MSTKKMTTKDLARFILDTNKKKISTMAKVFTEDKTGMTEIGVALSDMKQILADQFAEIMASAKASLGGENADALNDSAITLALGETSGDEGTVAYSFAAEEKLPGIEAATVTVRVGAAETEGEYKIGVDIEGAEALAGLDIDELVTTYGDLEVTNLEKTFKTFGEDLVAKYFAAFSKAVGDTEAQTASDKDAIKTILDTLVETVNQKFIDNTAFNANADLNVNYDKSVFALVVKKGEELVLALQYVWSFAKSAFVQEGFIGNGAQTQAIDTVTADNLVEFVDAIAADFEALGIEGQEKPAEEPKDEKPAEAPAADSGADNKQGGEAPATGGEMTTSEKHEEDKIHDEKRKAEDEERKAARAQEDKDTKFLRNLMTNTHKAYTNGERQITKEALIQMISGAEKNAPKELIEKIAEELFGGKEGVEKAAEKAEGETAAQEKAEGDAGEKKEEGAVATPETTKMEYKTGDEITVDGKKRKVKAVDDKNVTYTDEETGKDVTVPVGSFTEQTAIMNANMVRDVTGSQDDNMAPSLQPNHSFGDTNGKPSGVDDKKVSVHNADKADLLAVNKYTESMGDVPAGSHEIVFIASPEAGKAINESIKTSGVAAAVAFMESQYGEEFRKGYFSTNYAEDLKMGGGEKIARLNTGEVLVYKEDTGEAVLMRAVGSQSFMEARRASGRSLRESEVRTESRAEDREAVSELVTYIVKTGGKQKIQALLDNAAKKIARGTYDKAQALKNWEYIAEAGAKAHKVSIADSGEYKFTKAVLKEVAGELQAHFKDDLEVRAAKLAPVKEEGAEPGEGINQEIDDNIADMKADPELEIHGFRFVDGHWTEDGETVREDGEIVTEDDVRDGIAESLQMYDEAAGEVAGWVAFYQGKQFEIRKSAEVNGIWPAKKLALAHFKVPKSKEGLLAIEPAYDEGRTEGRSNGGKKIYSNATAYVVNEGDGEFVVYDQLDPNIEYFRGTRREAVDAAKSMENSEGRTEGRSSHEINKSELRPVWGDLQVASGSDNLNKPTFREIDPIVELFDDGRAIVTRGRKTYPDGSLAPIHGPGDTTWWELEPVGGSGFGDYGEAKKAGAKIGKNMKPLQKSKYKAYRESDNRINPRKYGRQTPTVVTRPTMDIPGIGGAQSVPGSTALADKATLGGRTRMEGGTDYTIIPSLQTRKFSGKNWKLMIDEMDATNGVNGFQPDKRDLEDIIDAVNGGLMHGTLSDGVVWEIKTGRNIK